MNITKKTNPASVGSGVRVLTEQSGVITLTAANDSTLSPEPRQRTPLDCFHALQHILLAEAIERGDLSLLNDAHLVISIEARYSGLPDNREPHRYIDALYAIALAGAV